MTLWSYTEQPLKEAGEVELSREEARHARLARRLQRKDPIVLFDGLGRVAEGTVSEASKKCVRIAVTDVRQHPRPHRHLTIGFAVPKGSRQDWLIEKCTELGVGTFQPIAPERAVAGAGSHKVEKWRRRMIEAAKQSRQPWLPEARPVRNLDQLVREFPAYKEVWLLTSQTPDPDRLTLNEEHLPIGSRLLALIGPEGGWTEGESAMLQEAGARKISLGPNVLRIETAAIAVAAMVHRML